MLSAILPPLQEIGMWLCFVVAAGLASSPDQHVLDQQKGNVLSVTPI